MKRTPWPALLVGLIVTARLSSAHADLHIPTYLPDFMPAGIVVNNMLRNQDRMAERSRRAAAPSKPTSTITRGSSDAAASIAATYPEASRPQVKQALQSLLATYQKIEDQFEIPRGDIAGAMTLLIASSVEIYRGQPVSPAVVPRLLQQFRGVISSNPAFAKLTRAQRRKFHETLAILGTMMASAAAELARTPGSPQAASYRATAAQYLQAMLSVAPERVSISDSGLEISPATQP